MWFLRRRQTLKQRAFRFPIPAALKDVTRHVQVYQMDSKGFIFPPAATGNITSHSRASRDARNGME
jgi:hypothetical protein